MACKVESGVFAKGFSQKHPPTKNQKFYSKVESGRFASGFCHSEKSKIASPLRPQSKVVFSRRAVTKTSSDQKSKILFVSRKWAFRLRLLPFCKIEHATGLQKVSFPSFWALETLVVLQGRTCHWSSESLVSIFRGARGSCLSAK